MMKKWIQLSALRFSDRRRKRAFSLIELITASAISIILIGAVLGITQTILDNFQQMRGGVLREGDAGVALDMMINDLEALVIQKDPGKESLQVMEDPKNADEGTAADGYRPWLVLLTRAVDSDPDDDDYIGTVRTVSYRLIYKDPLGAGTGTPTPIYALYRTVANSEDTFNEALGVDDLMTEFWTNASSNAPDTTDVRNYLVGNVVRFEIRFQRADDGKWTTSDEPVRIGATGAYVDSGGDGFDAADRVKGGFLAAEVDLVVLSPEGAKIFQTGSIPIETAIQGYGRNYVRKTAVFAGGR